MQNFSSSEEKVRGQRLRSGLMYGIVAGLAFASASWGYDDYLLAQRHGLLPSTKLIIVSFDTSLRSATPSSATCSPANPFLNNTYPESLPCKNNVFPCVAFC